MLIISSVQICCYDSNLDKSILIAGVSAGSTWIQSTQEDFENGTMDNVSFNAEDNITLVLDSGSIKDDFINQSGIKQYEDLVIDTSRGEVTLIESGSQEQKINHTFGGALEDSAKSLKITSDKGYIMTGKTKSYGSGDFDVWLLKTDPNGIEQWNTTIGGKNADQGYSVEQTSDGGYIIVGDTKSYGYGTLGTEDIWLIKTDENGIEQWNRTFGGGINDFGYSVLQTSDGGYILIGSTKSVVTYEFDIWVIKTNDTGIEEWNKTYGGNQNDYGYEIITTSYGGYALLGYFASSKIWLIKINETGAEQWNTTYEVGSAVLAGEDVKQTSDGGYVITGGMSDKGNINIFLIKTNQTGVKQWERSYGGVDIEYCYSVLQTYDGGYALIGFTKSFGSGDYDIWLVKTTETGIEQWNWTFGGALMDIGESLYITPDWDFIIAGYTSSFGAGNKDVWLVGMGDKEIQWNKTFGGDGYDWGSSVQQTIDGGYIVAGQKGISSLNNDVWLIKTDKYGNELWNKTFGGGLNENARTVQQTPDGGYIILANKEVNDNGDSYDFWLIKTDTNGIKEWDKTFDRSDWDYARSLQITDDGGFIIVGTTFENSYDVWVIRTNSTGDIIWQKVHGGNDREEGYSIDNTSDNGFIISGITKSFGGGSEQLWLIKLNSSGNEIWNKSYGGSEWESGWSVMQTTDGGYIVCGITWSYGAGYPDYWLLKTDAYGVEKWNRTFGGTDGDHAYYVQQTKDGGYILIGNATTKTSDRHIAWVVKTNETGQEIWNQSYGGSNSDIGYCIKETFDGGYVFTGYTYPQGYTKSELYLVKLNRTGKYSLPNGRFTSNNIIDGELVESIVDFETTALIPSGTGIEVQFSQNDIDWYNSKGMKNKWDSLVDGLNIINLSYLNWGGSQFYYRMIFFTENFQSPILRDIMINYDQYLTTGIYISEPYDSGGVVSWKLINWSSIAHEQSNIKFQLRTADNESGLTVKNFTGPDGAQSSYYSMSDTGIWSGHGNERWIQYKVVLTTANSSVTPILINVIISYNIYPGAPSLQSPTNGIWIKNNKPTFIWLFSDTDSSTQDAFQWQLDDDNNFSSINYDSGRGTTPTQSFTPSVSLTDGTWNWRVRTRDQDGEWGSYSVSNIFTIDTIINKPLNFEATPKNWTNINAFSITWTNPADLSGIAGAYYKIGTPPTSNSDGNYVAENNLTALENIKVAADGQHTIYVWLKDQLGNVNYSNYESGIVYYDGTPPDTPMELTSIPPAETWTSTDLFNLTWKNPGEVSGISGVYYTKGFPPTTSSDGTFIAGDNISSINKINFGIDGKHDYYIWLKDKVGNHDYTNAAAITLYLDSTPPGKPVNLKVTPDSWTNVNSFTVSWTDPSDLSGVKPGAYYYIGQPRPDSQSDGTWTNDNPFTLTDLPEGEYNIYVWLEDIVGNVYYRAYETAALKLDYSAPFDVYINIDDNAEYTTDRTVNLALMALDNISGIDTVSFGLNNDEYTKPESFKTKKVLNLSEGDGEKIITYKVIDKAGNTAIATDSIIMDTNPPHSLDISIKGGINVTTSTHIDLILKAEDATSGVDKMSFSTDGIVWSYWVNFESEKSFTLSEGDGDKTIYLRVKDKAGNIAEPVSVSITLNQSKTFEPPTDSDGDGYYDDNDAFPADPLEWQDSDSDGVGDNGDVFPADPQEWQDSDSDGVGDNSDAFPADPREWQDSDSDGVGDNGDAFPNDPTKWEEKNAEPDTKTPDEKDTSVTLIAGIIVVIIVIIILLIFFLFKIKVGKKIELDIPESKEPERWIETELRSDEVTGKYDEAQNMDNRPGPSQQSPPNDTQMYPPDN